MRRAPALVLVLLVLAGCGDGVDDPPPAKVQLEPPSTTLPIPDLRDRPIQLLAVHVDGGTDLLTLEGTALAHLPGLVPHWHDDATKLIVADAEHRRFEVLDDGSARPWTQVQGDLVKDEPPQEAIWPDGRVAGHWRARWTSPDGRTRLGYWSGECESPSAWFSDRGGPWRPVLTGPYGNISGRALGWSPDGRAIVSFDEAHCGTPLGATGTYLVDLASGLERVGPPADALWRRP